MTIAGLLADPEYGELKHYIVEHTGLSYYSDKDEDFATRLARRMTARAVTKSNSYLQLLQDPREGAREMDCLVGELTIGETYFFRQREHFDLLRETIIPELLQRNKTTKTLRIWSAGCATGAEPFSVSLLLRTDFRAQLADWDVSILATDINVDFLAQARTARFAEWALRDSSPDFRARHFVQDGKAWALRPEYSGNVSFQYYNLASDQDLAGSAERFDLIMCRNVLIYFSPERISTVVDRLRRALSPRGWLLVGYAEPSIEMFKDFETISTAQATVYRKRDQGFAEPPAAPFHALWKPWIPAAEPPPAHRPTARPPEPGPFVPPQVQTSVPTVDQVRTLADSGRWETAITLSERLIASDSLNPVSHFTSALIYEHFGATRKARAALQRAIYLDRRFALAHYHLGTLLQSARESETADRCFRNALEILSAMPEDEPIPHGDSITAGELRDLAASHLELSRA